MKGLEYGSDSTAFVSVSVTDVDEPPKFYTNIKELTVLENTTQGSVLLTLEAADPEGNEIGYELRAHQAEAHRQCILSLNPLKRPKIEQ